MLQNVLKHFFVIVDSIAIMFNQLSLNQYKYFFYQISWELLPFIVVVFHLKSSFFSSSFFIRENSTIYFGVNLCSIVQKEPNLIETLLELPLKEETGIWVLIVRKKIWYSPNKRSNRSWWIDPLRRCSPGSRSVRSYFVENKSFMVLQAKSLKSFPTVTIRLCCW